MKLRCTLALATAILSASLPGVAEAGLFSSSKKGGLPKELKVRTTAYTHTEADHLQYGKKTAAGGTLKHGRKYTSAAADWSKFPLGTKFKIDGLNTTFVVDDYGRALVGSETIDIYHPSKSAMNQWGVKHVDIEVLEYGDFEASREILSQRTKYAHVRKMLAGINKDPGPEPQKPSSLPAPKSTPAPPKPEIAVPDAPQPSPEPAVLLASAPDVSIPPAPAPSAPPPPAAAIPESTPPLAEKNPPTAPEPPGAPVKPAPAMVQAKLPEPTNTAPPPSLPTPSVRKVRPLSLQLASARSASAPKPEASKALNQVSSLPAAKPQPADAPKFRKRSFKPLLASASG